MLVLFFNLTGEYRNQHGLTVICPLDLQLGIQKEYVSDPIIASRAVLLPSAERKKVTNPVRSFGEYFKTFQSERFF